LSSSSLALDSANESPADPKRIAFDVVERNADQIATVGDVLYYFGEPGMQEYESSKYLKETLEQIGFKVEVGGAGLPTNVWATWGSGKPNKEMMEKYRRCASFIWIRRLFK
jgi:acetylornithine deacetylase/succinyl-diaminopimelate desuccinylase-like protein